MANAYYNFMEGSMGLGKNGTHLIHSAAGGGATYALGRYGGVEVISNNWWAPFVGAFAALGLSLTVRYLVVGGNDEKSVDLAIEHLKRDLKKRKMTVDQQQRLKKLLPEFANAGRKAEKAKVKEEEEVVDGLIENLG